MKLNKDGTIHSHGKGVARQQSLAMFVFGAHNGPSEVLITVRWRLGHAIWRIWERYGLLDDTPFWLA